MKCKGCGKDITGLWNWDGYGYCCVQHWQEKMRTLDEVKGWLLGLIITNLLLIAVIVYDKIF